MQLSERLKTVAGLVSSELTLADIGTDHAYIPIFLTETGIIPRAIAADINRGPLLRAQEHIRAHNLEIRIETRLSDGLDAFAPGEVQSILISGMGGALTVRILQRAQETGRLSGCCELILQPQSEIRDVRAWLGNAGWGIVREEMVFEDGKYYTMIKARRFEFGTESRTASESGSSPDLEGTLQSECLAEMERRCGAEQECFPGAESITGEKCAAKMEYRSEPEQECFPGTENITGKKCMTEAELAFGPDLLRRRHPILRQYLLHEEKVQLKILQALKNGSGRAAKDREQEIGKRLKLLRKALNEWEAERTES